MSSLSNRKAFADENILKLLNILFRYINKQNEKINATSNKQRYVVSRGIKILL